MISRAGRPSLVRRPHLIAGGLLLSLLAASSVLSAEPAHDAAQSTGSRPVEEDSPRTADSEAKKQALSFGLVMLAGIIVGGTMLLTLVVVWGNRTRRLARSPLPPVAKRDELWFLKPKRDSAEDPASAADGPQSKPESP